MIFQLSIFFFFNDTATTEIYTLSLHDALPISGCGRKWRAGQSPQPRPPPSSFRARRLPERAPAREDLVRSEEHTSELQSRQYLVCRLLLEKKKKKKSVRSHQLSDNTVNSVLHR